MLNRAFLFIVAGMMVAGSFTVATVKAADEKPAGGGKERVFEMRTYTAAEGKLEALHARFRDHTNKLFAKHGMELIGYWTPTDGEKSKNTLVYILAYPDRDAAKASWKAFQDDPDWKTAKAESEKNGKLVEKVESVFLKPTDYSPVK